MSVLWRTLPTSCSTIDLALYHLVKPKFYLLRRVTTRHAQCDERVALVALCLFQHGGRRRSSSARVYKFNLWCSGFASFSGTTFGKSEVDMSTPVHAVATPLNTCRASRSCRARHDERVAPCCRTSATRHVSSRFFPMPKCMG